MSFASTSRPFPHVRFTTVKLFPDFASWIVSPTRIGPVLRLFQMKNSIPLADGGAKNKMPGFLSLFSMSAILEAFGGCVRAPIVAQGGAGTFYAQRTPFRPRRRGFVSTPIFGTAHAGRRVRLAGLCALGFCMHRPSVAATARCAYGVF